MSKKIELCNGKKLSKKKLRKHFKKIRKEVMSTAKAIGLSKKDIRRIKKGRNVRPPKDEEAFMATFSYVFPGFEDVL
jgi:benzoyl-CoA reductase/2-hydroxyglutaryl-CoA dehydratase subunit BcrC/BadD/HgdB